MNDSNSPPSPFPVLSETPALRSQSSPEDNEPTLFFSATRFVGRIGYNSLSLLKSGTKAANLLVNSTHRVANDMSTSVTKKIHDRIGVTEQAIAQRVDQVTTKLGLEDAQRGRIKDTMGQSTSVVKHGVQLVGDSIVWSIQKSHTIFSSLLGMQSSAVQKADDFLTQSLLHAGIDTNTIRHNNVLSALDIAFDTILPFSNENVYSLYKAIHGVSYLHSATGSFYPLLNHVHNLSLNHSPHLTLFNRLGRYYRFCLAAYSPFILRTCCGIHVTAKNSKELFENLTGLQYNEAIQLVGKEVDVFKPSFYIAVDKYCKEIILSIKGTTTFQDLLTDICFQMDSGSHSGMLTASEWIDTNVRGCVLSLLERYPTYRLSLVGHSLGGAVVSLLCIRWMGIEEICGKNRDRLHAYAFGPPCVASPELAKMYKDHVTSIIFSRDIVSRLSLGSFLNLRRYLLHLCNSGNEEMLKREIRKEQRIVNQQLLVSPSGESLEGVVDPRHALHSRTGSRPNYGPGVSSSVLANVLEAAACLSLSSAPELPNVNYHTQSPPQSVERPEDLGERRTDRRGEERRGDERAEETRGEEARGLPSHASFNTIGSARVVGKKLPQGDADMFVNFTPQRSPNEMMQQWSQDTTKKWFLNEAKRMLQQEEKDDKTSSASSNDEEFFSIGDLGKSTEEHKEGDIYVDPHAFNVSRVTSDASVTDGGTVIGYQNPSLKMLFPNHSLSEYYSHQSLQSDSNAPHEDSAETPSKVRAFPHLHKNPYSRMSQENTPVRGASSLPTANRREEEPLLEERESQIEREEERSVSRTEKESDGEREAFLVAEEREESLKRKSPGYQNMYNVFSKHSSPQATLNQLAAYGADSTFCPTLNPQLKELRGLDGFDSPPSSDSHVEQLQEQLRNIEATGSVQIEQEEEGGLLRPDSEDDMRGDRGGDETRGEGRGESHVEGERRGVRAQGEKKDISLDDEYIQFDLKNITTKTVRQVVKKFKESKLSRNEAGMKFWKKQLQLMLVTLREHYGDNSCVLIPVGRSIVLIPQKHLRGSPYENEIFSPGNCEMFELDNHIIDFSSEVLLDKYAVSDHLPGYLASALGVEPTSLHADAFEEDEFM